MKLLVKKVIEWTKVSAGRFLVSSSLRLSVSRSSSLRLRYGWRSRSSGLPIIILLTALISCSKGGSDPTPNPPPPSNFNLTSSLIDGKPVQAVTYNVKPATSIRFRFGAPVNRATVADNIKLSQFAGGAIATSYSYDNGDSVVVVQPSAPLATISKYKVALTTNLKSVAGGLLANSTQIAFVTSLDSSRKFANLSDAALLDLVQKQTFKYFWDFGHPTSGLSRERSNGDNSVVTSGGSGFGIMSILVGIERGFITRAEGLARIQKMVTFLNTKADKFHGAFSHWLNGETGKAVPFSANDDGADLVETSYLIQGLLCARQYFNLAGTEATLRTDINTIWNGVEWDWFRKTNENQLYWHWTSTGANGFVMNVPIRGWNECLITYVLAASSTTHGIPKIVYDNGWAANGGMKNGNSYYGHMLPLGPPQGGPLFFSHYSFLGIDPNGLTDDYANYQTQTKNHTLINYDYCVANPNKFNGYSDSVWGLTASDIENGYKASSPTDDAGYIAPTAALSSFPYEPLKAMAALKFYYYVLGDKIWKDYGFVDAFSLHNPWFANSFLAIDQGPIIVMIENYRSGLLWDLFTSSPEVKTGMKALNFAAPYL